MNYSYSDSGYSGFGTMYRSEPPYVIADRERRGIRKLGRIAGLCVIGYIAMQYLVTAVFSVLGVYDISDDNLQNAAGIVLSFASVLCPFLLGALYFRNKQNFDVFESLGKPVSLPLMLFAVPVGLAACLVGNWVTNILIEQLESVGISLGSVDFPVPQGFFGRLIYAVQIAVVPPLTEELAVRGTVMQPLRKYGDGFAIVASSVVFALMHGNLVQAPFAFIAGITIGYAVCITGSLWTGILIHFCNNLYSVAISFLLEDVTDESSLNMLYLLSLFAIYAIGVVAVILFLALKKGRRLTPSMSYLTPGRKGRAFIGSPAMLIAVLIMLWFTAQTVTVGG